MRGSGHRALQVASSAKGLETGQKTSKDDFQERRVPGQQQKRTEKGKEKKRKGNGGKGQGGNRKGLRECELAMSSGWPVTRAQIRDAFVVCVGLTVLAGEA